MDLTISISANFKERAAVHYHLTGGKESIEIGYEKNVSIDDYENMMFHKRDMDLKYQSTSIFYKIHIPHI